MFKTKKKMEDISENKNTNQITVEVLSQNSIFYLRNTAPWVKFVSIAGLLMCIMLIAFAVIIINAPIETTNVYLAKLNSGMKNFIAVIYIFIAIMLLFPCIYLFIYSNRLKKFVKTNNTLSLEKAFAIQRKFWKYIGVLTIIILSFMGIAIVGLFAGTIAGLLVK